MRPTRRGLLLGSAAALVGPRPGSAQPAGVPDGRVVALRIVREVLVPGYRAFAAAAQRQALAWEAFRAAPGDASGLREAFQATADAWAGVEAVRFGPIAADNRYERVSHWPERRNAVTRAVTGLLAGNDAIAPERLRRASVAGQGLTALERLLYGETEGSAVRAAQDLAAPSGERRRALGVAVADNVRTIAAETLAAWTGDEMDRLERASPDDARDVLTRLATDQLAGLETVAAAKIGTVLGPDLDGARSLLAEGWRSGRSLRTIALNLQGAEAFARAALATDDDRLRTVAAGIAGARSLAETLAAGPASLGALAADPKGRPGVLLLRDAVASAREVAGSALAEALGVTIGFNSRDGD